MPELTSEPVHAVLARAAMELIEYHGGDWGEALFALTPLHWDGEKIIVRNWTAIHPEMDPAKYPHLILSTAQRTCDDFPDNPPYAYGLLVEVTAPPPDGRTSALALVADIHGRLWTARRYRDGGETEERMQEAGKETMPALQTALIIAARVTAVLRWGLPMNSSEQHAMSLIRREMN